MSIHLWPFKNLDHELINNDANTVSMFVHALTPSRYFKNSFPIDDKELSRLLDETDTILVTHIHRDHWDVAAQKRIDKNKLIFCQPGNESKIREQGFQNVKVIDTQTEWQGITIHRTSGQHGTGEIRYENGCGFRIRANYQERICLRSW